MRLTAQVLILVHSLELSASMEDIEDLSLSRKP